ncbi:MAG: hypothetical protein JW384_01117 [Nitrosomonadaceae bacterium]|nr:hypothetical protein [Nitrosomonadaceae bacterium]
MANGLTCFWHRTSPLVAHFRKKHAYADRPWAPWLSGRSLSDSLDAMQDAGLVEVCIGKRFCSSSYRVTERLLSLAEECGVALASLSVDPPPDLLIRLYAPKGKRNRGYKSPARRLLTYAETEQVIAWKLRLLDINAFLLKQEIGIDVDPVVEGEWIDSLNSGEDREGPPFKTPDLTKTALYRVFSNGVLDENRRGNFDQGGRLYGGWWINAPKHLRPKITINGQVTVELDYSGCHINMLYHERGLECEGDPYEVPEISEYEDRNGLGRGTYRQCIKEYTQALINGSKGGKPSNITLKEGTEFPEGFRPIEIVRAIERRHELIKDAFRSNAGLRLQLLDSEIALEVVSTAMEEGWVALPVHDSFITTTDEAERLRELMLEEYINRFGFYINIK